MGSADFPGLVGLARDRAFNIFEDILLAESWIGSLQLWEVGTF